MQKNLYTTWDWNEAPTYIRSFAPFQNGTWIVRVEPGDDWNYGNYKESWTVVEKKIEDRWYLFIQDTSDVIWPKPVFY